MGIMKMSNKPRTLEDSSWLAQTIKDKMDAESEKMGLYPSTRYSCLNILYIIVREADNQEKPKYILRQLQRKAFNRNQRYSSMAIEHGTDFDRNGMQAKLRGLAERYRDDNGMYIVSVLTTNDLNSAIIKDLSELMFQMNA